MKNLLKGKGRRSKRKAPKSTLAVIASLFFMSIIVRLTDGAEGWIAAAQASASASEATSSDESSGYDREAIKHVLDALREREKNIAAQEQDIEERLAFLHDTEARIDEKVVQLREAEAMLRSRMAQSNTAAEEDLTQLTTVYAKMKPKDAALLFEQMEPKFAAGFLGRMKPDAAASIMAGLSPQAAYTISVVLAGRNANAITQETPEKN